MIAVVVTDLAEVEADEITAAEVVVDMEEEEEVMVAQEEDQWKCTRQLVPIAVNPAKYLSDLVAISRFSAAIVSRLKMAVET